MRLSVSAILRVPSAFALFAFVCAFAAASTFAQPLGKNKPQPQPTPQTLIATTTAMSFSPNSVAVGGVTTVTLTVTPASGTVAPTGIVAVYFNSTQLFSLSLSASGSTGTATSGVPTSGIPVASYGLTAVYEGNSTFATSTSPVVTVNVQSPVTVTFTPSPNPVALGQGVTFTTSVAATEGGGTPTGSVQYLLGGSNLGPPIPLSNGTAAPVASTTGLPVSTYPLSAKYLGDTLHASGTSSTTNVQLVSDVSITTTNTPSATDGSPYTENFSATGGSDSYSWAITSGLSALQTLGLNFTTGGVLSGTPNATGSYAYTVKVTDTETGETASAPYTLVVNGSGSPGCGAGTYSISGTVSYSGSKTGRIYIGLGSSCGGGTQGTSISAAGTFTIRGVPSGTYTLTAFMDTLGYGVLNAADPSGTGSPITVNGANVTGAAITLTNPATVTLSAGPQLQGVAAFNSGAAAFFKVVSNSSGVEAATSYTLQWSTSSAFTTIAGSKTFAATGSNGQVWFVNGNGLVNGTAYYFRAYATSGGTAASSYSSVYGPVTIGAPSTGNQVSGSVAFSATATGPLYVGFLSQSSGGVYVDYIPSPASAQTYSVKVPSGTYQFFAILDQTNAGIVAPGVISNISQGGSTPTVTISGATTNENLTLPSGNGVAVVNSFNTYATGATNPYTYGVQPQVYYLAKLPVAVTLLSSSNSDGANITGPIDVANCQTSNSSCGHGFQFYYQGLPVSAAAGDTYTFSVTYSDGTTQTLTYSLPAVLNVYASNLSPTTGSSTSTTPTFTWTDPANASDYSYQFALNSNQSTIWEIGQDGSGNGFASTITSIPWGTDPTGNGNTPSVNSLTAGDNYEWQINVVDSYGNQTATQVNYQP